MKTVPAQKVHPKPLILTGREEAILRAIATHYYMSALDVAHLLYSPKSLTHVRQVLSRLAGNADYVDRQLLYRFPLPTPTKGMKARVYALGAKGRDVLAEQGYYRPYKLRHISYSHISHHLALTRFVVAAHYWCRRKHAGFNLLQTHLCYELARTVATFSLETQGRTTTMPVIPDAWLLFQRVKDGAHFPVFVEIDRSTEYRQKLQAHIKARLEFIRSGAYSKMFGTKAVIVAYVTTGDLPECRETRRKTMCAWTKDVLSDLHLENWSHIFRFTSVVFDELYTSPIFDEPVWYTPDSPTPVALFDYG